MRSLLIIIDEKYPLMLREKLIPCFREVFDLSFVVSPQFDYCILDCRSPLEGIAVKFRVGSERHAHRRHRQELSERINSRSFGQHDSHFSFLNRTPSATT